MNNKIVDYFVVEAGSRSSLMALVITSMKVGWKPIGGVSIAIDPYHEPKWDGDLHIVYAQAMVIYDKHRGGKQ